MSETNFLADYADLKPFAKEANRHPRTVRRWLNEPDGLPYTRLGNRILIHIPTAREWLFARMHHRTRRHDAGEAAGPRQRARRGGRMTLRQLKS